MLEQDLDPDIINTLRIRIPREHTKNKIQIDMRYKENVHHFIVTALDW